MTIAPWSWSISTLRMLVRLAHWSRRRPVTHASSVCRCLVSGRTLRTLQQSRRRSTARLEEVDAVLAGHRCDLVGVGLDQLELQARVAVAQAVGQLERLGRQAAGVDAEDRDVRIDLVGHVDQHDAVDLERRRDRDARREPRDRPLEQRLRLLAFELDRELARLQFVDQLDAAHASTSSLTSSLRRLEAGQHSKLVVGRAPRERREALAVLPLRRASRRSAPRRQRRARRSARAGRASLPIAGSGPRLPRTKMS